MLLDLFLDFGFDFFFIFKIIFVVKIKYRNNLKDKICELRFIIIMSRMVDC